MDTTSIESLLLLLYYICCCGHPSYRRFTYEIAPVFTLMEDIVLTKMRECIGWENGEGDGIFAPGGSAFQKNKPRHLYLGTAKVV